MLMILPPPLLHHERQHSLRAQEHALGVDSHDPVPGLLRHINDRYHRENSNVVHQGVDRAVSVCDLLDHVLHLGLVGHVHANRHGLGPGFFNQIGGLMCSLCIQIGHHHRGAFPCKGEADLATDAPSAARHQCYLIP